MGFWEGLKLLIKKNNQSKNLVRYAVVSFRARLWVNWTAVRRSLPAWAFLTHLLLMMPVGTNLTEWWIESIFFLFLQTHQCIRIIQRHGDRVCSQTNGIWVSTELIHIFCVWSTLILAGFNSRQLFKANTERTSLSFYLTKNKQDQWKYFWFDKEKNIKATSTVSKIYTSHAML